MQEEIESLLKRDQEYIQQYKSGKITLNKLRIKAGEVAVSFFDFYKKNGFPFKKENPEVVYRGALALALHQPVEKLEIIFNDLKNLDEDKIDTKDLAYMVDKIAVLKEEAQVYGTQYKIINSRVEFLPIKDKEGLDDRRSKVGLEPLEEYIKTIEAGLRYP